MKKKFKKIIKNKKLMIFLTLLVIFLICIIILRGVFFPGIGSKYGNRLDGINKISFTEKDQKKVTKSIKDNEKVSSSNLEVFGKRIDVEFNVNEDVSIEDAKAIAQESLSNFSDEVKGFYDIQYIITKTDEKGEEVQITNDDGTTSTEIKKQFPIMGYKNSSRDNIVW